MHFFVGGEDEQIIHVYEGPPFCDHVSEGIIHEVLESCHGIHHSEEHYHWFKEPSVGGKGPFPLMSVFDAYIIVPPPDVKLGKEFCSLEFVEEVRNQQEGISVTDCVFV